MNILIADDSDFIRTSLAKLLAFNINIEIINLASTVKHAIDRIRFNPPDVLILDINFPEGSGFEVLVEAKRDNRVKTVIMLTNYPYEQMKARSFAGGADYFLDKSEEFEKVVEIVNDLIDKSRTDVLVCSVHNQL